MQPRKPRERQPSKRSNRKHESTASTCRVQADWLQLKIHKNLFIVNNISFALEQLKSLCTANISVLKITLSNCVQVSTVISL